MTCYACANVHLGQHLMDCAGCRVRLAEATLRVRGLRSMVGHLDAWDERYGRMPEVREQLRAIVDRQRQQRTTA